VLHSTTHYKGIKLNEKAQELGMQEPLSTRTDVGLRAGALSESFLLLPHSGRGLMVYCGVDDDHRVSRSGTPIR
jgi:hypothetical protein